MFLKALMGGVTASRAYWAVSDKALPPNLVKPGGFSKDFQSFLMSRELGNVGFLKPGAFVYGGKSAPNEPLTRRPVIFIHGNSDSGEGARDTVNYLRGQGYKKSEIYVTSYGPGRLDQGWNQPHDPIDVREIRAFIDAVHAYAGVLPEVRAHSEGVTNTRGALGGLTVDRLGRIERFAPPLQVETLIGLAGANEGVQNSQWAPFVPACSPMNGMCPGSRYLRMLELLPPPAKRVFTIVSTKDGVIGTGDFPVRSGSIPNQIDQFVSTTLNHMQVRDNTLAEQQRMSETG